MSKNENDDLEWFMDKIITIINYKNNDINTVDDLRKYIYVNDFKEEEFKKIKDLFNKYGEKKVLLCIIKLKDKNLNIENKTIIKNCLEKIHKKKKSKTKNIKEDDNGKKI